MITRVFRSQFDMANLSRKRTVPSIETGRQDYRRVVINKPWGYEYLLYENSCVAVWILCLNPGFKTSMHCHPKKRTSLVVLSGHAITSTLDTQFSVKPMEGLIIDSGVFHSTKAVSEGPTYIMEVETPPDKGDLVRLKDEYGREGKGYESVQAITDQLSAYEYVDFHDINFQPDDQSEFRHIGERKIEIHRHGSLEDLAQKLNMYPHGLVCILDDRLFKSPGELVTEVGDVLHAHEVAGLERDQQAPDHFHSFIIH